MSSPSREFEPSRAVEIITRDRSSKKSYGSGYLISGGLVLTAAHLFDDRENACTVRRYAQNSALSFREEKAKTDLPAKVVWKAQNNLDIALIELREAIKDVSPAVLGRFPKEGKGIVAFQIAGYPRLAVVEGVSNQLTFSGTINLSDSALWLRIEEPLNSEYSIERIVKAIKNETGDPKSEWSGMSGAAVFCDNLLVAVQMRHQRPPQPNFIEATPLCWVYSDKSWQEWLKKYGIEPKPKVANPKKNAQASSEMVFWALNEIAFSALSFYAVNKLGVEVEGYQSYFDLAAQNAMLKSYLENSLEDNGHEDAQAPQDSYEDSVSENMNEDGFSIEDDFNVEGDLDEYDFFDW